MSALAVTLVIKDGTDTMVHSPDSWPGYVTVWVTEGVTSPIQIYVTDEKARELVEQLTAALAVKVG